MFLVTTLAQGVCQRKFVVVNSVDEVEASVKLHKLNSKLMVAGEEAIIHEEFETVMIERISFTDDVAMVC